MAQTNWAGNHTYGARTVHRPGTIGELQEIVAGAPKLRALGSRHAFNAIADSVELISLDRLPADVSVDGAAQTVSFGAQVSYGELAVALEAHGLALANLASLPHICVAGAVATATHGSGDRNSNLAGSVAALELVKSDGELLTVSRGESDFSGLVVALGAAGVVTRVTLDVEPAYDVRQRAYNGLAWNALREHFDAITASGYSVSIFTLWSEPHSSVWIKTRVDAGADADPENLFGATAAGVQEHMIARMDPINTTPQLGVPGLWSERLAHFRMGFTPSAGEEIQSEYHIARRHAIEAIQAIREIGGVIRPLLQITEIRTVAADDLWLSPQYEQDTVGIHFTWIRDQEAVERALVDIEAVLAPFEPRPHWGKVFLADAQTLAPRYPRLQDFAELIGRLDSRRAFTNEWLERHVLGDQPII